MVSALAGALNFSFSGSLEPRTQLLNYLQAKEMLLILDDFEDLVFAGHPLGKNILGTRKSVNSFTQDAIRNFIARNYRPERIVIAQVAPAVRVAIGEVFGLAPGEITSEIV